MPSYGGRSLDSPPQPKGALAFIDDYQGNGQVPVDVKAGAIAAACPYPPGCTNLSSTPLALVESTPMLAPSASTPPAEVGTPRSRRHAPVASISPTLQS